MKVPIIMQYDTDEDCKHVVYSSNATGKSQLYIVPTDLSSKTKQITSGIDPIIGCSLSPKGNLIVYPRDKDGNEIPNLMIIPAEGGEAKQITIEAYRTMGVAWHPNGKELSRTVITPKGCGIEIIKLDTEECFTFKAPTPILLDAHYSHNGKWIACTAITSFTNTQVYIMNRDDPEDIIIYNITDKSREGLPSWSPDDKKIAFGTEATGRGRIAIQDFQGDERLILNLDEDEGAPVEGGCPAWNPQSTKIYYVVSKHSRTSLIGHPIDGEKEPPLPFPQGTVVMPQISKDGKSLIANHSSMTSPTGVYLYKIGSESIISLTPRTFNIDLSLLVNPESVWYDTFDRRKIHSWYIPAADRPSPYPAVIHAHGGPWGQVYDCWFDAIFMQTLSQSGLAAFGPNFRGSTGYGSEFQDLDIGDPGGGDLEDIVHGAEWLRKRPEIDGTKVGIMGGSYGGYMTLIALTKKPDTFAAGVSLVPVVDWVHMYKLSDPFFQQFESELFGGKPRKEKKDLYIDRSPITHVSKIKSPVMIMAGKTDSRCPIEPIEAFIEKLKEMNHSFEFVLEEKAGHISALLNWEESVPMFKKMTNYLKKNLE